AQLHHHGPGGSRPHRSRAARAPRPPSARGERDPMSEFTTEGRYLPPAAPSTPPAITSPDDQATRLRALMQTVQRPARPAQPVRPPQRIDPAHTPIAEPRPGS